MRYEISKSHLGHAEKKDLESLGPWRSSTRPPRVFVSKYAVPECRGHLRRGAAQAKPSELARPGPRPAFRAGCASVSFSPRGHFAVSPATLVSLRQLTSEIFHHSYHKQDKLIGEPRLPGHGQTGMWMIKFFVTREWRLGGWGPRSRRGDREKGRICMG